MMVRITQQELDELGARIDKRCAKEEAQTAEYRKLSEAQPGEYREGFIDGYLRAHEDGQEYQCSVARAEVAFGKYLSEGGRTLPRTDVPGW